MSALEAFSQWRLHLSTRFGSECQWSRFAEALGRLIVSNSQGAHGRVVLSRLNDLETIVSDLRVALGGFGEQVRPVPSDGQQVDVEARGNPLWLHLKPEVAFLRGMNSDQVINVDGRLIEQVIERYVRSQWLTNDCLEWMMVDALVYHDAVSFGESIKRDIKGLKESLLAPETGRGGRRTALRAIGLCGEFSAFVAGPVVVASLAPHIVSARSALWIPPLALACIVIYANVAILRTLRRKHGKKLITNALVRWSAMAQAYRSLEGTFVSLAQVRHALEEAAARGAKWSGKIFTLLEYAETRGARNWKL